MGRKSAVSSVRVGVAVVFWVAAVSLVQITVGAEIGTMSHRIQERYELRVKGQRSPRVQAPERTHEAAILPWELVAV
jgi:hypothetical protein